MRYRILTSLVVLGLLAVPVVPVFGAGGIKDNAGLFSPNAVMEADGMIARIKSQYNDDLLIETFKEVPADVAARAAQDRQAARHEWAVSRARENKVDGVYLLINQNPGFMVSEVGTNTQKKEFTLADRAKLDEVMLKQLGQRNFDQALLSGVKFVHDTYAANVGGRQSGAAAGSPVGAPAAGKTGTPQKRGATGLFTGSCFMWVIIAVVAFFIFRMFTNRRRQNMGGAGYGYGNQPGGPGMPPQMPGQGYGYGPGQGPAGGGMGRGLLGGLLGGMAGGYLWDKVSGRPSDSTAYGAGPAGPADTGEAPPDTDYTGGGGDFGGGGGDLGGGGDFGGGDSGGGGDF